MKQDFKKMIQDSGSKIHASRGFTLIEIVVSTTIFATVLTMILVLFNYTLQINRKTEHLRQALQGSRNFMESLVKEIRNGKVDYSSSPLGGCSSTYSNGANNFVGITNIDQERECFYISGTNLMLTKATIPAQVLNPPNFTVTTLKFYVRPTTDPYAGSPPPRVQPFVTIVAQFQVQLGPGDTPLTIPYQTTVSTDVYDIPQ